MSGYIDLNYISKIQPRLQQFKKKRDYLFNFRCPVCGDSKKSKTKARAYLYRVKNDMFFKCHNCSASHNLANLIKLVDRPLYDQYILERYKVKYNNIGMQWNYILDDLVHEITAAAHLIHQVNKDFHVSIK